MTARARRLIRAERFELVDGSGRVRAVLAVDDSDAPGLTFYDQEHHVRLVAGLDEQAGGWVCFCDRDEHLEMALLTDPNGRGLLMLDGPAVRASLIVSTGRDALFQLADRYDNARLEAVVDRFGRPGIGWRRRPGEQSGVFRFDRQI